MSTGKRSEWERNNAETLETEHDLLRSGLGPVQQARAQALCSLGHTGAPFPSAATLLRGQHLPHLACPWSPSFILLSSRPLGFTGNALSLIGIETHSPPFSCRWGFHRKKLLLCFCSHQLFGSQIPTSCSTGSSPSWTDSCPSLAGVDLRVSLCRVCPGNLTSPILGPLRSLQMKMALPGNPASSIII